VEAFKAYHKRSLPKKNRLYFFGSRFEATIHARMRIGNSPLKAHLANILHVVESPLCPCGGGEVENPEHFFFRCPLFNEQRDTLVNDLLPFDIIDVDELLYGISTADHISNLLIFGAVHKYIKNSKRFA
jgi:hypothetical protein